MKIFEEITKWGNEDFLCEYIDEQNFSKIHPVTQVQALCLTSDKEFVVYKDANGNYGLPGGTVEKNETLETAIFRELREEAAVQPIRYGPLLYLKVTNLSKKPPKVDYQVRYWATVKLLNEPVSDPAHKAVSRHILNERELLSCLKWGRKLKIYLKKMKALQEEGIIV